MTGYAVYRNSGDASEVISSVSSEASRSGRAATPQGAAMAATPTDEQKSGHSA